MANLTAEQLISKAKAALILDQPFFASLLLNMDMQPRADVPTMGTDGERIVYNPDWTAALSLPECTFVLGHEVMHCAFQHMFRLRDRDAKRWNVATDYVINAILITERVGSMPHGGLHNPQLVQQGGGTADGVYALIPADTQDQPMDQLMEPGQEPEPQQGEGQQPGEDEGDEGPTKSPGKPGLTQAELQQKEDEQKVRILQARNAAKAAGKLSAALEQLVKDATKPVIDWKAVLRRFLTQRAKETRSYARPKRRFLGEDLYMPSLLGEKCGRIAVAVDCSGSVSDEMLQEFARELRGIIEDTQPAAVDVIYFTDRIVGTPVVFVPANGEPVELKIPETGGTAFSPIFEHIADMPEQPAACVVFTDLYCDDFGPAPDYPVLWADYSCDHAPDAVPFGEVLPVQKGK